MTAGDRVRSWLPWATICLAVFLVYGPAIHGGLIMDDAEHITPPALRSVGGLARIWFEVGATPHYYPVLNSVFWLEQHLWGESPVGYHLVNILQQAAAACLLVLVVRRLLLPGAFLAGLIFAIHPVHVESVAWISEQKNTLSTLLALGATLAYLDYRETRRLRTYGLASLLFLLALLSKTVVAVVPPALLVIAWWQQGRLDWRRDGWPLLPWITGGAALGLFSAWFERVHSHAEGAAFALSWLERTLVAGRAVCFYARTLAWPADLMYINPRWSIDVRNAGDYAGVGLVLLTGAGLLVAARRWRGPLAAYLLFVGMLFPVLGFLNINWFNFSYVANHFQHLPSIGLIVPAAVVAYRALARLPRGGEVLRWVLPGLLVAGLGWVARVHCEDYRTPVRLYTATVAKNPDCWLAYNNLGVLLLEQPGQLDRATEHFARAVALKPDHARAHNNYGTALSRAGRLPEALAHYRRSLELQGDVAEVHTNYGRTLRAAGAEPAEALAHLDRAMALRPDYLDARLARAELLAGWPERVGEAAAAFRDVLALAPESAAGHLGLADLLAPWPERRAESVAHYREAIRLDPAWAAACNNLGILLSTEAATRPEAVALLTRAVQLDPGYADARFNLGVLLASHPDRRKEALDHLRVAVQLRPADPETRMILAALLAKAGDGLAEAATQLEEVIRRQPDSAQAHRELARVLAQLPGRAGDAEEHWRRARELAPEVR